MLKKVVAAALLCLSNYTVFSQKVSYQVSFPNIVHHEAKIDVTVTGAGQKDLVYRMSRSSPGRYATHEFGKNVYDVKAFDRSGKVVKVSRLDGDVYQVPNSDGFVKVQYTLYANHPDGTYAGIDPSSIQLNAPASFMWIKGLEKAPVEIKFDLPSDKKWTIATQLRPSENQNIFTAPDLQYFMDSPVKIGSLVIKEWDLANPDKKNYRFRLALEATGSDSLISSFAGKIKKVTQETQQVYGEFPAFDYGQYTFLASINPYVKGDGMEHRNSTMIAMPTTFTGSDNLLGVFSHEFFHAWNVERIRPKSLEPFNYEKSNMSFELWFAEGFTQYYGELILERAGFRSLKDYCGTLSSLINTKENTSGAKRVSPVDASNLAIFVDAGVAVDKTNYPNYYTSYYPYGGSIALALDLELRSRGLSLDEFMKAVWLKLGKPEQAYVVSDLENVLASVTKDKTFASNFFEKYVNGFQSFNYTPLLQKAGLSLQKQFEDQAWLGDYRFDEGNSLKVTTNTRFDTPLYEAGLDIDDQIVKLDGKPVNTRASLETILASHKPGEEVVIEFTHRGESKTAIVKLTGNPKLVVRLNEELSLPVTDEMKNFRKSWLDSKIK
ncbi:M61 family metallopeptidase [Dyadobacter psychrotolerans]|uniref:M61 family peptidase n=1 Tax=Dyadobacter psychrotolerans TaxID=2541721 RepID=A0A4R5DZE1_9BACT|nr:PDZ domain-containing protein [Dyadobacter psychrotolerans]TDE17551.1 M61 family peptidase [Dyadobacter psychrotolerans]